MDKAAGKSPLKNNVFDTALLFEGGGMRASYTSAITAKLLSEGVYFDYVAGISAGSSNAVNYLSRDIGRTRTSFVDFAEDPNFGGMHTFLQGKGYFSAAYIYEETCLPGNALPYDFETYARNSARLRIGAVRQASGEMRWFGREDANTMQRLLRIVRASSSVPFWMPPVTIEGEKYVDGGVIRGLPLHIALQDGYQRFFVVLTRPKGYRKSAQPLLFLSLPAVGPYAGLLESYRHSFQHYNDDLDALEELEKQGKAYLVYAEDMLVEGDEMNVAKLRENYARGERQADRQWPEWRDFIYR
ncbi:MAG: patatin family protein [Clostridiales bacterium]|nr:patatin family protein [Clostridiales bacterium]